MIISIELFFDISKILIGDYHPDFLGAPQTDMIFTAMEAEHMGKRSKSKLDEGKMSEEHIFTSSNYKITTTPEREWRLVVERVQLHDEEKLHDREIPDFHEILRDEKIKRAKLRKDEVVAVILFTGPMVRFFFCFVRLCVCTASHASLNPLTVPDLQYNSATVPRRGIQKT